MRFYYTFLFKKCSSLVQNPRCFTHLIRTVIGVMHVSYTFVWRWLSSGMHHRVSWQTVTDVPEELIALVISVMNDHPYNGDSKLLWNVRRQYLLDYTVLYPGRQPSSYSLPWEPLVYPIWLFTFENRMLLLLGVIEKALFTTRSRTHWMVDCLIAKGLWKQEHAGHTGKDSVTSTHRTGSETRGSGQVIFLNRSATGTGR
jgi:hypothetical protein